MMRIEQKLPITNRLGIHARVAAKLVAVTTRYEATVSFVFGLRRVNGKNLLDILTLACPCGSAMTVEIDGPDAQELFDELLIMAEAKFGED